jgi:sulfur-carrier protein
MDVTINLYATFRQIAGVKSISLDLPPSSRVCDLLENLCLEYPALRAHLFDADGKPFGHIHLFVNKRDITYLPEGLEGQLHGQDTLDIFPPVGGG